MIAARVAMIVKTTSSSTSVNPRCRVLRFVCMLIFHEAFAFLKSLVYIAMWRCISVLAACNIGRSTVVLFDIGFVGLVAYDGLYWLMRRRADFGASQKGDFCD